MITFETEILYPIRESIRQYSDRNAFYISGTFYTYRQLSERISAIRGVIRTAETNEPVWALHLHDDLNTYAYYHISNDKFRRKRYAVLTFDDGYSSLLEILPWLKEMGLPFTLFINGKYLDGHSFRENPLERYLTFSDIRHIVHNYEPLVDIQSHGWEHNDAAKMSSQEFERSLIDNIRLLSGITNRPIIFHAYTWGSYTKETDEVLKNQGLIPVRINGRLNYHDSSCVERYSVWNEI